MKPTKQTIYTPVKVEDASGNYIPDKSVLIVKEQGELDKYWDDLVKPQEGYFFTLEQFNEYTADVIKQALKTAAEKAEIKERKVSYSSSSGSEYGYVQSINKQSITNTFQETFNKLKVWNTN